MKFRRPPTLKTADDFISAAGTPIETGQGGDAAATAEVQAPARGVVTPSVAKPAAVATQPWEGKRADKPTEVFNLRLTEVELEKLRFIAANTPDSMQAFVRKTLLPAIDAKLDDLV